VAIPSPNTTSGTVLTIRSKRELTASMLRSCPISSAPAAAPSETQRPTSAAMNQTPNNAWAILSRFAGSSISRA
jgi:hypothetical protein